MSDPTISARYANAVPLSETPNASLVDTTRVVSASQDFTSSADTSSNIMPMQSFTSAPSVAPVPVVAVVPPPAPPAPAPVIAATPQIKYDDPEQRRRLRRWYLFSGIFLLLNAIVLAAVGGAVDSPYYRAATGFNAYDPATRRFRYTNLDYRGNMLIVPYISIFVGIAGIGFILTGIWANKVQRSLASRRQNYPFAVTILLACAWETILFAFAIGVSEIFLMIALGGLTIALFGFWMLMDDVNRPGTRTNFGAHILGWAMWAVLFTILFAYTWANSNRAMPAILFVTLFMVLAQYTLIGLIQFVHYVTSSSMSPYRTDRLQMIVHTIFFLVVGWLLFAAFIGIDTLESA